LDWGPDRSRLYGLALREAGRAIRGSLLYRLSGLRLGSPVPTRLLFAPQDLRTSDPTVALEIYSGYFAFAGRAVTTGGRSPFEFPAPSRAWAETLYGFGWLRHMRAAGTSIAQANGRALVDDFIRSRRGGRRVARQTQVLSRRLISFISQSPLILEGADHGFYRRFMRALGRSVRELERDVASRVTPARRLTAIVALCYAGLCCEGLDRVLRRATRLLERELERQILADGGHISRNPKILVELLLDLLPLRQIYASRGVDVPEALLHAIDRMLPMVRMFRHGDGTLSHFNGMGLTLADRLATLLIYDDTRSQPIHHAPHSGYERIEAGGTLLVADVGRSPPIDYSAEAGAGCLSFELSSGSQWIVVNCGAPRPMNDDAKLDARATAAHSTASIDGISSARMLKTEGRFPHRSLARWLSRRLGNVILTGPRNVAAQRGEKDHAQFLSANHDGYARAFGITHERHWRLSGNGERLDGEDIFHGASPGREALIRFHLAPGIRASRAQSGRVVVLVLPNREAWQFEVNPAHAVVEPSVFYPTMQGAQRTEQIVIPVDLGESPTVRWRFDRLARSPAQAQAAREAEPV
jgi:uncharacterized heparinase superfamily protein